MHQPFPSSEIFRCLINREELLRGMLCADHVCTRSHAHMLTTSHLHALPPAHHAASYSPFSATDWVPHIRVGPKLHCLLPPVALVFVRGTPRVALPPKPVRTCRSARVLPLPYSLSRTPTPVLSPEHSPPNPHSTRMAPPLRVAALHPTTAQVLR